MVEKDKKPDIRFTGFTYNWEESELNGIAEFSKGHGYSKKDLIEDGIPIILYGRLYTKYQTVISEVDTFALANNSSTYSTGNEVIVPSSGETAEEIARASAIVKSGILLGGDLNVIHPSVDINSIFLALTISNGKYQKELSKRAQGKSVVHLHNSDLKEVIISYPNKEEQIKIGTFFKHVDSLITLHQRKYDKLVTIKKSMLEKMFPKEGADTPEIRFAGFTEPWEQYELGELMGIASASRVHKNEWTESGVPFFRSSDVVADYKGLKNNKAFISFKLFEELSKKSGRVQKNDILVTGGGSIGIPYLVKTNEPLYFKDADLLWLKNSDNINSYFLYTFFSTSAFRDYVNSITHIGTISHYTIEQAKSTPFKVPEKEEQNKVAEYFLNLSTLITLQKKELDKLKNIKKACLEKMFV